MPKMGNIIPPESPKGQEIEDLAYSVLKTFSQEYTSNYGCELLRVAEESEEEMQQYSLSFCPWQRLDHPIKKGYLRKQGLIVKRWKRRYFVVQPNFYIDYYENEEVYEKGMKPKGTIKPCGYKVVPNLEEEMTKTRKELASLFGVDCRPDSAEKFPNYTFGVVQEKSRTYIITAETEAEKLEWVEMFQLCAHSIKGFTVDDPVSQAAFNKAIVRTLKSYGNPSYHSFQGTEEKIICDVITAEINSRFFTGIYKNVKGNFATKMKIRDQVIRTLDSSVLAHVNPAWKILLEDKEIIRSKVKTLLREKRAEIAAVRRKVEWEMNGKTEKYIKDALAETKVHAERLFQSIEKSMIDALCEVRDIYQTNIVEIAVDVIQREEVEIPLEMYITSMDMLARTPAEMQAAYKHLDEMRNVLEDTRSELRTFIVSTIILQAQEKLRLVMDALVNTFQQKFLKLSLTVQGNQKHKELGNLIEDIDEQVANDLESDLKDIINTFTLGVLKDIFVPFVHSKIDSDCKRVIDSAEDVIPEHLRIVLTLDGEYEAMIERSVENLLKEVMNISDESKQRSFASTMRSSRRGTFPKFSSRRTKFQTGYNRTENSSSKSMPVKSTTAVKGGVQRKTSLGKMLNSCLPIHADYRNSTELVSQGVLGTDNMEEISLTIDRQNGFPETNR